MPSINNEHLYATLGHANSDIDIPPEVDVQGSIDLLTPTIPLPQAQAHQLHNEDIALISLSVVFILISLAAAFRLYRLYRAKSEPRLIQKSKVFAESSSTLPLTVTRASTLNRASFEPEEKVLDFADEKIERDITYQFSFARPISPPPGLPVRVPAFRREEEEDIAAILSLRAGAESVYRRGHRDKVESESSQTTATTVLDSLCPSVQRSSVTSIYDLSIQSEAETEEEEELEEVEIYEVKRAQTQSMEVKRGVLMSWRSSRPSSPIPDMPTFVISESVSDTGALSRDSVAPGDDSLLQAQIPSFLITHPSDVSLVSTTSSVSVDLDEFPLPPTLPPIPQSKPGELLDINASSTQTSRKERRSTVEQVITMYES